MSSTLACNCGNSDPNSFDNGTCTVCGIVCSETRFAEYNPFADDTISLFAPDYKNTYLRSVHLTERFREHNRSEPDIPEADLSIIYAAHKDLCTHDWFYRECSETQNFNKKNVQRLLRFVDKRQGEKRFTRLYLGTYPSKKIWWAS